MVSAQVFVLTVGGLFILLVGMFLLLMFQSMDVKTCKKYMLDEFHDLRKSGLTSMFVQYVSRCQAMRRDLQNGIQLEMERSSKFEVMYTTSDLELGRVQDTVHGLIDELNCMSNTHKRVSNTYKLANFGIVDEPEKEEDVAADE